MALLQQDWTYGNLTAHGSPGPGLPYAEVTGLDLSANIETQPLTIPAKAVWVHFNETTTIVGTPTGLTVQWDTAFGANSSIWDTTAGYGTKSVSSITAWPFSLTSNQLMFVFFNFFQTAGPGSEAAMHNPYERIRVRWQPGAGSPAVTGGASIRVYWEPL